jgi:hypothetical protein
MTIMRLRNIPVEAEKKLDISEKLFADLQG